MHAGFPCFNRHIQRIMRLGAETSPTPMLISPGGKPSLVKNMASLLKSGFTTVMGDSLVNEAQAPQTMAFFKENFVFIDPNAPGGNCYYQGKFLIRTRKPGDRINVYLQFCPEPEKLFVKTPFGPCLNPLAVVDTKLLSEQQANRLERNPDQVDLVIQFKDLGSILGLIGRPNLDMVGMLLENIVQLKGNVGHLFKLGAIAENIELAMGLS